jgi:regulation of enolase protein 1 (concanavalin A-like superfamily)
MYLGETTVNLLSDLNPEALKSRSLKWEHPPLGWETLPEGGIRVTVPPKVDYFQDPTGGHNKDDAPYLWLDVSGDFVAQAHVKPTFTTTWDAGALMARFDAQHWAKLCYESTDLGTLAAVSVVTNGKSDDANGANLTTDSLWLQIFRVGDVFGLHYALDGKNWQMVRIFRLAGPETIKVGLVAQCPVGPGTTIDFFSFSVENRTLQNPRAGI